MILNPNGFISGANLLDSTTRHEAGIIANYTGTNYSHHNNYVQAQNDPFNNVGLGLEPLVKFGVDDKHFTDFVRDQGSSRGEAIKAHAAIEPCNIQSMFQDGKCVPQGNINYAPYQVCPKKNQ